MTLRIAFWMDPLEQLSLEHDTTLALMREACRRGHQTSWLPPAGVSYAGSPRVRARRVALSSGGQLTQGPEAEEAVEAFDVVFLRKDPPVDAAYLDAVRLFGLALPAAPRYLNAPPGLLHANEKLFGLAFPDLMPPTLVTRDVERLRQFVEERGTAVLKPLDGFAGRGVFAVTRGDLSLPSLLELATGRGARAVVAQPYLPESRAGDKRILLLDGEPLGAILRVPRGDDLRCNLAAGGKAARTTLTARDLEICRRLSPELRRWGLSFVGIDVIGEHLTEVNVTSPTGLVEAGALEGRRLEEDVLAFAERG